uniref:CD151 antigen n=1 Tax=Rhipicephalus zambeziensis TaxID=60191 RepID=A0A224YLE4_9ACAR
MVCGLGLIKGVLCALNLTISLLGVAAIVVAAIVLNNPNLHDVNDHLGKFSNYPTAATFALVAGVTVLLFGVCGCCGACFGVGWLLLMFIIIMAGFVIVETVAMGLVWKYANSSELEQTLTSTLYTFIEARKSGLPNFLHDLQRGLSCCGAKGPDDYPKKWLRHTSELLHRVKVIAIRTSQSSTSPSGLRRSHCHIFGSAEPQNWSPGARHRGCPGGRHIAGSVSIL